MIDNQGIQKDTVLDPRAGMHWKGGVTPHLSRAPSLHVKQKLPKVIISQRSPFFWLIFFAKGASPFPATMQHNATENQCELHHSWFS